MPSEPPVRLREKQKALTRQVIIDAAVTIFAEEGFGVSVDRVVQRAGTSRATFYLHFPSKLELARAVNDELDVPGTRLYDSLRHHAEQRLPLRDWITEAIAYWTDHRDAIATAQQAIMSEPAMLHVMQERTTRYARVVADLMQAGGSDTLRLTTAVVMILQLERVSFLWKVAGWDLPDDDVVTSLTDAWGRVLEPWASAGVDPQRATSTPSAAPDATRT